MRRSIFASRAGLTNGRLDREVCLILSGFLWAYKRFNAVEKLWELKLEDTVGWVRDQTAGMLPHEQVGASMSSSAEPYSLVSLGVHRTWFCSSFGMVLDCQRLTE